ncbi:MAG: hypothetical protein M0Z46_06070 [Actinomycetota bacterium]|nr:hypothetical protein [Actinomycetota bacterium]
MPPLTVPPLPGAGVLGVVVPPGPTWTGGGPSLAVPEPDVAEPDVPAVGVPELAVVGPAVAGVADVGETV